MPAMNIEQQESCQEAVEPTISIQENEGPPDHMLRLTRLQQESLFTDVVVSVAGRQFPVHRCVLAAASPHFLDLMLEKRSCTHFRLDASSPEVFKVILDYCYTGHIQVPVGLLGRVHGLAMRLKMDSLARLCGQALVDRLTPSNAMDVRRQISVEGEIMEKIDEYMILHLLSILKSTECFASLPLIKVDIIFGTSTNDVKTENLCQLILEYFSQQFDEHAQVQLAKNGSLLEDQEVNGGNESGSDEEDEETQTMRIERFTDQVNLLYLTPGNTLVECDKLQSAQEGGDLPNIVPAIRDYLDLKRVQSKLGSRSPKGLSVEHKLLCMVENVSELGLDLPVDTASAVFFLGRLASKLFLFTARRLDLDAEMSEPHRVQRTASTNGQPSSSSNQQEPLPLMTSPRAAFGLGLLGDCLIVSGGYNRGQCLRSAESYSFEDNVWKPLPDMITARGRFSSAVISDRVYACGGSDGNRELSTVEEFDGSQWLNGPAMVHARSGAGIIQLDGCVYAVGGRCGATSLRKAEFLDPRVGFWQHIPSLLESRNECLAASFQGKLWIAGGSDNWSSMCLSTVEVFDPRANQWTFENCSLSQPRRGAGVIAFGEDLWIVGGSDGNHPALTSCEIFRPGDSRVVPSTCHLNVPRANLGLIAAPERLYAVGGFSGKLFLDTMEVFDPDLFVEWSLFKAPLQA